MSLADALVPALVADIQEHGPPGPLVRIVLRYFADDEEALGARGELPEE